MNPYGLIMVLFLSASDTPDYLQVREQAHAEYVGNHFTAAQRLFLAAIGMLKPGDERQRAATLAELGDAYVSMDELSKAESAYSESLEIYKKLSDKSNTVLLLRNLGAAYSLEGRDDDALRLLQPALKLAKTVPAEDAALMAELLNVVGMIYYRQGKMGKAGKSFDQALETIYASPAQMLNNLGAVYIAQRKFQKAEDILKKSLKVREAEVGQQHPDLTFTLVALGVLYTDWGKYAEAEDQELRALKILEPYKSDLGTRIARIFHALSKTYKKAGRKTEAETALAQAAAIAREHLGQAADMAGIIEEYSTQLSSHGKTKEANELRVEAKRARVSTGLVIHAHNPF